MRIKGIKILRVYGKVIEQEEFPIPNQVKPTRPIASQEELRVPENLRRIALHHVIRDKQTSDSARTLKKYERHFARMKKKKKKVKDSKVMEYLQVWKIPNTNVSTWLTDKWAKAMHCINCHLPITQLKNVVCWQMTGVFYDRENAWMIMNGGWTLSLKLAEFNNFLYVIKVKLISFSFPLSIILFINRFNSSSWLLKTHDKIAHR